jgi:hypothetical protein
VPKILYIAGWGRSGTTLLDNVLGQVPGWVSTGELHNVWQRGLIDDRNCGCGQQLRSCPVWQQVFQAGFGGIDQVDPHRAVDAISSIRTREIRRVVRMLHSGTMLDQCAYAPFMKGLYDGIVAATEAQVIVDSSKFPVDPVVAAGLPGYDVYVVHMVRDPRAVAFSWQRRKQVADKQREQGLLKRVGLVRSTVVWQVFNAVIARKVRPAVGPDRYLRVQYEHLAAEPKAVLDTVLEFAGEGAAPRPAFDGNVVDLQPTHTASGNPNRFMSGPTKITADAEWHQAMPSRRKLAVSALAYPTLRSMGYPWRS